MYTCSAGVPWTLIALKFEETELPQQNRFIMKLSQPELNVRIKFPMTYFKHYRNELQKSKREYKVITQVGTLCSYTFLSLYKDSALAFFR